MADTTRDRILEAAYRTLVRRGYHETSMKDIAEEAGVAPGLAHYY
ncbi:MAG: helix-turn-helix transcriptional regulator, partial [Chloroflexi bacterium]